MGRRVAVWGIWGLLRGYLAVVLGAALALCLAMGAAVLFCVGLFTLVEVLSAVWRMV
jgi:hypothetical protein